MVYGSAGYGKLSYGFNEDNQQIQTKSMVRSPSDYAKAKYDDTKELVETILSDGVQSVDADALSVGSDGPTNSFEGVVADGVETGFFRDASGVFGSANTDFSDSNTKTNPQTFSSAFSATPTVTTTARPDKPGNYNWWALKFGAVNPSTTGFDLRVANMIDFKIGDYRVDWIATRGR